MTTQRSRGRGHLCEICTENKKLQAEQHRRDVAQWIEALIKPLPAALESLEEMFLLDKLCQSDPFKDRSLRASLMERAGFSVDEVGTLFDLGVIRPAATTRPETITFGEDNIQYSPLRVDWIPNGEGLLDECFEAIESLASSELHAAVGKFPHELGSLAADSIVWEAERYLLLQLGDRGIDEPTEAQLTRFRDSVRESWATHSLGEFYYAIWPGCAKAADNRARNKLMGRAAVTGSAVNMIVNTLSEFRSNVRAAKRFNQPNNLPLSSRTVSLFRIAFDLDPMSALESDVIEALGTEASAAPVAAGLMDKVRHMYTVCLQSMAEEHAFTATMIGLDLLIPHHDVEEINAVRSLFTGERFSAQLPD